MSQNNKLSHQLEEKLQRTKYLRHAWIAIVLVGIFLLALSAIPLGYLFGQVKNSPTANNIDFNHSYALGAKVLVYISYGFITIPFIYLAGAWVSGINNTSKSKNFHLFVWIVYTIGAIQLIIAIILAFRAGMI